MNCVHNRGQEGRYTICARDKYGTARTILVPSCQGCRFCLKPRVPAKFDSEPKLTKEESIRKYKVRVFGKKGSQG